MDGSAAGILCEDASVSYRKLLGRRRILSEISFSASPGEITAIIGPNGAGKTTLFRTLLGFLTLDGGKCLMGGLLPGEYRKTVGIGYQPEDIEFPGHWSARDILGFGLSLSRIPEDQRREAFHKAVARTRFDASTLARPARRYSRGMKRRLSLAYALIGEPAVTLLDEPFAGLDPPARLALRKEIVEARDRGATVVLASHELAEIERLANRAFVLEGGRIRSGPALTPTDVPIETTLEAAFTGEKE